MPFCHWICSSCKQSSWDHHICLGLWAIVSVTLNWKFSCQRKKVLDENSALCGPGKNEIIEVIIISENLKWKFLAQLMSSLKTFWACHGSSNSAMPLNPFSLKCESKLVLPRTYPQLLPWFFVPFSITNWLSCVQSSWVVQVKHLMCSLPSITELI